MASFWQKTLFYLGLVDEESADGQDGEGVRGSPTAPTQAEVRTVERPRSPSSRGAIPGRRVDPPTRTRRRISGDPDLAEAGVYMGEEGEGSDSGLVSPTVPESKVVTARSFSDAQRLADFIRERTPVILDLRTTEPEMVRRLVDFASGLTYSLDGTMRKVAQGVILVSPPRVILSRDERRRLADLGLYDAPDYG